MKESKIIKIFIVFSFILVITGGFLLWQKDWFYNPLAYNSDENNSFWKITPEVFGFNEEKTYLLLFQNNMEIRPTGGYLGNFGIIKIKNAQPTSFEIHDTNIFDGFGKIKTIPPQPMQDYLGIKNWQMRDGNWSPDFLESAQKVEYFYHLQGGQEEFDGIIAFNASGLKDFLKMNGPIYIDQLNKEFNSTNILYDLEYEVERGYLERGYGDGERKTVFKILIAQILDQIKEKNFLDKMSLINFISDQLNKKNILLYSKENQIQKLIQNQEWGGRINRFYQGDYIMINEANLGAKKSNYFVERELDYFLDMSGEKPKANLKIKFNHSQFEKNWFNDDYRAYLRIYLPKESSDFTSPFQINFDISEEFNKKVIGFWIDIPAGTEKIFEINYLLPDRIKGENYKILIEKQAGINILPFQILLKTEEKNYLRKGQVENIWEKEIFLK